MTSSSNTTTLRPLLMAGNLIEPGSQVELDGSRSYDRADFFAPLTFGWRQSEGRAGQLEVNGSKAYFTAPAELTPGETFTIELTVTSLATGQSAAATATLEATPLIGSDQLSLTADLPAGLTLLPRGGWSFDVLFTAKNGMTPDLLRSLSPARLYLRLAVGDSVAALPCVVHRRWLNRWRVFVTPVPAGETVLTLMTELVRADLPDAGAPSLTLHRPAESISSVIWQRNDGQREVVPIPWLKHEPGSTFITMHEKLRERFDAGVDGFFEVRYYAVDYAELSGWYGGLGLTPSSVAEATLLVAYGEGPYVDPDLSVSGIPWGRQSEAGWSAPVRLAGRLKVHPYYHLWQRDGQRALLREPYEGIVSQ